MTLNLGRTDRLVRLAVAILLLIAAFALMGSGAGRWLAAGAGVVLLGTAAAGTCPAYLPFRFSTRR
ncbi:MAG TPA: DUF2892 domain-containing protein [Bacteroidetes bacterium]|nr:DUF2892 domain-containing protein [Bacteroidota bacterium]